MSTVLLMHIIPSHKWLTIEYPQSNSVALLFWSNMHSRALGCLFGEWYSEAMLSHLLMSSKEVGNAESVQQTSDIYLTLPPSHTAEAEK